MPAAIHTAHVMGGVLATGVLTPMLIRITDNPDLTLRDIVEMTPGYEDGLSDAAKKEMDMICEQGPKTWQQLIVRKTNRQLRRQYKDHKAGKETYPIEPWFVQGDYGVADPFLINGKMRLIISAPFLNEETGELDPGPLGMQGLPGA